MEEQPQRKGGRQKGSKNPNAGRPKGSPNLVTRDLAAAAREYTTDALKVMAEIMMTGESEAARIAAAEALLSRGYGKPKQSMELSGDQERPVRTISDRPISVEDWNAQYGRPDPDLGAAAGTAKSSH